MSEHQRPSRALWTRAAFTLVVAATVLPSCAQDQILAVPASPGDGGTDADPNLRCAMPSDPNMPCPGWTCDESSCVTTCGDGVVAGDEECDPPDGETCDTSCWKATKPEACDMTGWWIIRQTNFSLDKVLGAVQTSSNWALYHIQQSGSDFVVDNSLICGIRVSGTVDVNLSPESTRALMYWNPQHEKTADRGGMVRHGKFQENASGGCDFSMERMFYLRGGKPSLLPATWDDTTDLTGLPPLPASKDAADPNGPAPTDADPHSLDDALDVDGDGTPGVAYLITGLASGTRNVVQRDWEQRQSDAAHPIAKRAIEFTAGDLFGNEENILHVGGCSAGGCGVLTTGSYPQPNAPDRIVFRWLGKTLDDERVARVITGQPGQDEAADVATCANVRTFLPHDKSKK